MPVRTISGYGSDARLLSSPAQLRSRAPPIFHLYKRLGAPGSPRARVIGAREAPGR